MKYLIVDAVDAFATINRAHGWHCRAARALAETYFDVKQVVEGILNTAPQRSCTLIYKF